MASGSKLEVIRLSKLIQKEISKTKNAKKRRKLQVIWESSKVYDSSLISVTMGRGSR